MIVTEAALREQLRRPTLGARVSVPPGATLSPAARDFVAEWHLELDEVAGGRDSARVAGGHGAASVVGDWNRPSSFPVALDGDLPRCVACGEQVHQKPDQMTQLDACHLAPKTTPRIRLRGRLDSLQALALLAASRARGDGMARLAATLEEVAAYCRELLSAEYNERPAAPLELDGRDDAALREATHAPERVLGVAHLTPAADDPELLHWLNVLRCDVREVEIVALDAFPSPHHAYGASIVHALNRLSSGVYYLELRLAAERESGP
jgi:ethanolamine utilization cobalamin adenosyltransferase